MRALALVVLILVVAGGRLAAQDSQFGIGQKKTFTGPAAYQADY